MIMMTAMEMIIIIVILLEIFSQLRALSLVTLKSQTTKLFPAKISERATLQNL